MTCTHCQAGDAMPGHKLCEPCHIEDILRGADWAVDITGTREDEETVLSAVMLGQFIPRELGMTWRCFSGYRVPIWRALCQHYRDGVTDAPCLAAVEQFMAHTLRVRGESLGAELRALRWARPFIADEYVTEAAGRLLESARGRALSRDLARIAIGLNHGAITCQSAIAEVRRVCGT